MPHPTETPAPPPREDVAQIHAVRALATAGIFLHHLWNGIPGLAQGPLGQALSPAFQAMALGVAVFNVMAGFVLARQHFGPAARPPLPFRAFLSRRMARLAPLYGLCLLLFLPANILVFNLDPSGLWKDLLLRLLFLQSLDFNAIVSNTAAWWWLSLLVQFTLAYPQVLGLFLRIGPARGFGVLAVACWGLGAALALLAQAHPGSSWPHLTYMAGFNLPLRLPEFALGMWLAAAWKPENPGWPLDRGFTLAAAALVLLALAAPAQPAPAGGLNLPALLPLRTFAVLGLFLGLFLWPPMTRLGRNRHVRAFSAASYGVYLTHQPLLSYLDHWLPATGPVPRFWLLLALGAAASLALTRGLEALAARLPGRGR